VIKPTIGLAAALVALIARVMLAAAMLPVVSWRAVLRATVATVPICAVRYRTGLLRSCVTLATAAVAVESVRATARPIAAAAVVLAVLVVAIVRLTAAAAATTAVAA
jgi:hypothetical protein